MRTPPEFDPGLDWFLYEGAVRFGVDTNFFMSVQLEIECIGLEGVGMFEEALSHVCLSQLHPTSVSIIAAKSQVAAPPARATT
jgi:hypothetical protein